MLLLIGVMETVCCSIDSLGVITLSIEFREEKVCLVCGIKRDRTFPVRELNNLPEVSFAPAFRLDFSCFCSFDKQYTLSILGTSVFLCELVLFVLIYGSLSWGFAIFSTSLLFCTNAIETGFVVLHL